MLTSLPVFRSSTKTHAHVNSKWQQKRKKVALVLICALMIKRMAAQKRLGRPFPVKRKVRKDFWKVVRKFNSTQFKNAFRLTCVQFRTIVSRLKPRLDANKSMADISSGIIQAEVKVAIFLRILAGASYHDLCIMFDIPTSSAFHVFHSCLNALLEMFSLPGLPENEEELKEMAFRFKCSRKGGSPLNGCVGALDGIAIKIAKPSKKYHPALYYCRKGFYAIPVQALVDSDYRFRCFSALCVGATHDSLTHSVSSLGRYLADGKLLWPFWIAADEAYVCAENLLTPFANSQLDRSILSKYKDSYNFFHSSLRMHVEQAFGFLVARFGILWRPLRFSLATNSKVILAAMILHNFCIDNGNTKGMEKNTVQEEEVHKRAFSIWYHECRSELLEQHQGFSNAATGLDAAMAKSSMRRGFVALLKELRLCRPYGQTRFEEDA